MLTMARLTVALALPTNILRGMLRGEGDEAAAATSAAARHACLRCEEQAARLHGGAREAHCAVYMQTSIHAACAHAVVHAAASTGSAGVHRTGSRRAVVAARQQSASTASIRASTLPVLAHTRRACSASASL